MAWLAVDQDGSEYIYTHKPIRYYRYHSYWGYEKESSDDFDHIEIQKGTIETFFGINLTWADEPVEVEIK